MVLNHIQLLKLTKIFVESLFDKFGMDCIGAVEMLWSSGIMYVSDLMCSVIIINMVMIETVFQNIDIEIFQSRLEKIILQVAFMSLGILTVFWCAL